jgi:hypothetical protein
MPSLVIHSKERNEVDRRRATGPGARLVAEDDARVIGVKICVEENLFS